MIRHKRLSPGVEFNEIDRSQYNQADYTVSDTAVFMAGFADKGEDYAVRWINTVQSFRDQYGYPTNQAETYLYNGVVEALSRGAFCLVSKLPYVNESKDMFPTFTYKVVMPDSTSAELSDEVALLKSYDASISSVFEISAVDCDNGKNLAAADEMITIEKLDQYLTDGQGNSVGRCIENDTVKVVDITRKKYGVNDFARLLAEGRTRECLGSVAVFTGAANAIYYQHLIGRHSSVLSAFEPVADMRTRCKGKAVPESGINSFLSVANDYLDKPFSGVDETLSKDAVGMFPAVGWMNRNLLDSQQFKRVGLVVFRMEKDQANDCFIRMVPVESFVGQLDRNAKDPQTGASDYLCSVVNRQSNYVKVFANVENTAAWRSAVASIVRRQTFPVAGFYESECAKDVTYQDSIVTPLRRVLDRMQDPNQVPLDIVVDAGMSNIAQFVHDKGDNDGIVALETYPLGDGADDYNWKFDQGKLKKWQFILKTFDDFCKNTRRDCMFIADGPRQLVLNGDQKVVRSTNFKNSIKNSIVPNVRYMQALNSSYSAGYCNWFLQADDYTGDLFWCPPSIKAMGVYSYTDAYAHTWNAPAGMTRGRVRGALDVSFNPLNDEAGQIYQQAWNYAVNYPINGVVLEGQKTFQIKQTALDRVNVRRLMLYLEKSVVQVARRFLYEGNTPYTRQRFADSIEPFFEEAESGDGISEYVIRCDDKLNTPEVIDNNELRCVIGIKPIKAIEWIVINFIITNQSANVSEEVMSE